MRVSAAERQRSSLVAEDEILRFAAVDAATGLRPHALWHKHVHNVELDPLQVLKMLEMDRHRNTVDFSSRRTGKTSVKEMYNLERLATGGYPVEVRVPLIPDITDTDANLIAVYGYMVQVGLTRVTLLPCNPSAGAKWPWLGRECQLDLTPQTPERLAELVELGEMLDLEVRHL